MLKSNHPQAKTALATGDVAMPSLLSFASPSIVAGSPTGPTPLPKPRATHNDAGWGSGVPLAHPDRNRHKCLSYLTCMLDLAGLHPISLLRALGVIMHGNGGGITRGGNVIPLRVVVGHWLLDVGRGLTSGSTIRVPGLWKVSLQKDNMNFDLELILLMPDHPK
jgi:hypothetical protein